MRFNDYLNEAQKRGSKQTALAEAAQCIAVGISQIKGGSRVNPEDFTIENAKRASRYFDIDTRVSDSIDFINQNEGGMNSTIWTIDALLSKNILKKKSYVAHRGSDFMNLVYERFKQLKEPAVKIVGRIDNDKGNPGDIGLSTINKIPKFSNLAEYNEGIWEKFQSGELVSLSLKKATSPNPQIKLYNEFDEDIPTSVQFKKVNMPKGPYSSTGMIVETSENKIVFRTFTINKEGEMRGEISGESAAGGKVSKGIIDYYLKEFTGETIISKPDIKKMSEEERVKKLRMLYKQAGFEYSDSMGEEGIEEVRSKDTSGDGWGISKIQSVDLCGFLVKDKEMADMLITYLYLYASSRGLPGVFKSSTFVKVSK